MTGANVVCAFSGPPGSGKTSLTRALAAERQGVRLGFGDFVRERARTMGLPARRATWQELGSALKRELGPQGLCQAVLEFSDVDVAVRPVFWDGVRHLEVLEALRQMYAPTAVRLAYLIPPSEADVGTGLEAEAGNEHELHSLISHETERNQAELRECADWVVSEPTYEAAAQAVRAWLFGQR